MSAEAFPRHSLRSQQQLIGLPVCCPLSYLLWQTASDDALQQTKLPHIIALCTLWNASALTLWSSWLVRMLLASPCQASR